MSLVSTYVRFSDGYWYGNPVLTDSIEDASWFICYDDDEPIELVVENSSFESVSCMVQILEVIHEIGYIVPKRDDPRWRGGAERCFPHTSNNMNFKPAHSIFLKGTHKLPDPQGKCYVRADKVFRKRPEIQGVYYDG